MAKFEPPNPRTLVQNLGKAGEQSPRILKLRFPRYKNLLENTELSFTFPFTVLVGKNGTNKSSVLHALHGSVRNQTPSKYWFDTAIDPISLENAKGVKNSLAVQYRDGSGHIDEALKYRTYRDGFEAYWEAAKRTSTYGFPPGFGRADPVAMNVEYFDFRGELSAFDKCFYFIDKGRLRDGDKRLKKRLLRIDSALRADGKRGLSRRAMQRSYSVQDYIRNQAPQLKRALDDGGAEFSEMERSWLSYVVGREYKTARLLNHKVYGGHSSNTVFLEASNVEGGYSSAFAGSGEFSAAVLIYKLSRAPKGSLVLLDEPETSLHPTAQSRLRNFLMHCALRKSMQIIAATHASAFLRHLPPNAIKLFRIGATGQVHVLDRCSPSHAFVDIDDEYTSGLEIHVEDDAAQILIDAVIASLKVDRKLVRAKISTGGESAMWRDVETYSRDRRDSVFMLFDGDQTPTGTIQNPSAVASGATRSELDRLIRTYTKQAKLSFAGADPIQPRRTFLKFFYKHVEFLPGEYPEQLVWDSQVAEELLKKYGSPILISTIDALPYKERYYALSTEIPGNTKDSLYRLFVGEFILRGDSDFEMIQKIVTSIVEQQSVGR